MNGLNNFCSVARVWCSVVSRFRRILVYIVMKLTVFENKVLGRLFVPRRDEVTGEWRRLHNVELNDLYCSPSIVRVIKWRRMRWAGHVARMGEEKGGV